MKITNLGIVKSASEASISYPLAYIKCPGVTCKTIVNFVNQRKLFDSLPQLIIEGANTPGCSEPSGLVMAKLDLLYF